MIDLTLYCNSTPTLLPRSQQFNQINLICNSHSLTDQQRSNFRSMNYAFDDVGDNISMLNSDLGDLTGLYWVWKNTDHDWVGTNQYRRFWDEQQITSIGLRSNTVYVYDIRFDRVNALKQFVLHHGIILPQMLYEAASQRSIDMTQEVVMSIEEINYVYACNMFFCERELFNKICQKFFEITLELYQGSKYTLPYIDTGTGRHRRGIAFLAERILTLLFKEKQYYFGNIDIQPIDVRVV
jgi:hypothetical protein